MFKFENKTHRSDSTLHKIRAIGKSTVKHLNKDLNFRNYKSITTYSFWVFSILAIAALVTVVGRSTYLKMFAYNDKTNLYVAYDKESGEVLYKYTDNKQVDSGLLQTQEIENIDSADIKLRTNDTLLEPIGQLEEQILYDNLLDNKKIDLTKSGSRSITIYKFGVTKSSPYQIYDVSTNDLSSPEVYNDTEFRAQSNISTQVMDNGLLDIVFIPAGYDNGDLSKFYQSINEIKGEMGANNNFFREIKEKINYTSTSNHSEAELNCKDYLWSYCCLNMVKMNEIRNAANAEVGIVIINKDKWGGGGCAGMGNRLLSAVQGSPLTVVHELGHAFGNLSDEYIYPGNETKQGNINSVNCKTSCSAFDSKYTPNGCFEGCVYGKGVYRTEESSVMEMTSPYFARVHYDNLARLAKPLVGDVPEWKDPYGPDDPGEYEIARITTPVDGVVIKSLPIYIEWSKGVNIMNGYRINVSALHDGRLESIVDEMMGESLSKTISSLPNNTTAIDVTVTSMISDLISTGDAHRFEVSLSDNVDQTPPVINIATPQDGSILSNNASINISANDNVATSSIKIFMDNVLKNECSSTSSCEYILNTTLYSNGAHVIKVDAFDTSSNKATKSITVTINNIVSSPAEMVSPTGTEVTLPVTFTWNKGVGANEYLLFIGTSIGTSDILNENMGTNQSKTLTTVSSNIDKIYIRLTSKIGDSYIDRDYNYNVIRQDTESPSVTITSPNNNQEVTGSTVKIVASAMDNVKVAKVVFYVNNFVLAADSVFPFESSLNLAQYSDGERIYIKAIAYDTSNNSSESDTISIVKKAEAPKDQTPPTVNIISPTNNAIIYSESLEIAANASDNVKVEKVSFAINGINMQETSNSPYTIYIDMSEYNVNDQLSIQATAIDSSNNKGYSNTVTVTKSTISQNEKSSMISPANGSRIWPTIRLSWTKGQNIKGYLVQAGTSIGGNDVFERGYNSDTNSGLVTISDLKKYVMPGTTVYLTLKSYFYDDSLQSNFYSYTVSPF